MPGYGRIHRLHHDHHTAEHDGYPVATYGPLPRRRPSMPVDTTSPAAAAAEHPPVPASDHVALIVGPAGRSRTPEFMAGLARARRRARRSYWLACIFPAAYVSAWALAWLFSGGHPLP